MIEKIPLLNSKSTLKKIIGIFVYSFLLLFVIGLIGSILDPVDRPAEIIDVDLGAYMVSFEGSSLNSVGKGITIYHNPRSNKSLCQSPRKNSSG